MGIEKNVGLNIFPKQGEFLGKNVDVCFKYDTSRTVKGKIVRDDVEEPGLTVIQLSDGRYILGTECQYHLPK